MSYDRVYNIYYYFTIISLSITYHKTFSRVPSSSMYVRSIHREIMPQATRVSLTQTG